MTGMFVSMTDTLNIVVFHYSPLNDSKVNFKRRLIKQQMTDYATEKALAFVSSDA